MNAIPDTFMWPCKMDYMLYHASPYDGLHEEFPSHASPLLLLVIVLT